MRKLHNRPGVTPYQVRSAHKIAETTATHHVPVGENWKEIWDGNQHREIKSGADIKMGESFVDNS